jgi:hypothetical protein
LNICTIRSDTVVKQEVNGSVACYPQTAEKILSEINTLPETTSTIFTCQSYARSALTIQMGSGDTQLTSAGRRHANHLLQHSCNSQSLTSPDHTRRARLGDASLCLLAGETTCFSSYLGLATTAPSISRT